MNLYTVALMARRDDILRVKPGIVIAESDEIAEQSGNYAATIAFPESEGWYDWQVVIDEIPSPMHFEGHTLTWQVTHDE